MATWEVPSSLTDTEKYEDIWADEVEQDEYEDVSGPMPMRWSGNTMVVRCNSRTYVLKVVKYRDGW